MMRPGQRQTFTITQVATVLGLSRDFVRNRIVDNKLAAVRHPITQRREVTRAELLRYLRENNFPEWMWRPAFQPQHGRLLVVRPADDIPVHRLSACDPTVCRSLVELGVWLGSYPAWGVILDFVGLGRDAALETAGEMRQMADHPLLIGVTAEDEATRPRGAVDRFDLLIPRPVDVWRLVRSINTLRKSVLAKSPRIAEGGGGFRRLGVRRKGGVR